MKDKIKCSTLTSCTVITKDNKCLPYVLEDGITLEELNTYFTNQYKENLDRVVFGQTFGYIHKKYA